MKATLEYTIPEELVEFNNANDGAKAIGVLQDVNEELRKIIKYGEESPNLLDQLSVIRKSIYEAFPDLDNR